MVSYNTVYLDVAKEAAAHRIKAKLPGVHRRTVDDSYRYQTPNGVHLATLSDATVESGRQGSKLRYRTSVVRPHLAPARSKAKAIRDAVDEYRTTPGAK